jgi:hypothetical protein
MRFKFNSLCFIAACGIAWSQDCKFAGIFTCTQFQSNQSALAAFMDAAVYWEGRGFHAAGVGYEPNTAFTYDGHPLNQSTGELYGTPHLFSAASKESIHVGLLALAVAGDTRALVFAGGLSAALELLTKKITTYEAFNATSPGYGCFLPWVAVSAAGIQATSDWSNPWRTPALDNGELVWSVLAAAYALRQAGYGPLSARYLAWFECMASSAKTIFYRGGGYVNDVIIIRNVRVTPRAAHRHFLDFGLHADQCRCNAIQLR